MQIDQKLQAIEESSDISALSLEVLPPVQNSDYRLQLGECAFSNCKKFANDNFNTKFCYFSTGFFGCNCLKKIKEDYL